MDSNIGKKLDGRYELLELIGVGGMADIYKARDIVEDRIVAVKILKTEFAGSDEFLRRFRNESKAIALLSHPNIVKIYDVGFTDKVQFIVMEYVDGITLTDYIEQQGVLKWRDAVHFTIQILKALQHAHDRGIVHRDIKSSNVMLLSDGTIKVMDFGIARFNRENNKTMSEKTIGSVHYISPEQARGDITDERSDIYSVGVALYEMLTGRKPFDGDTPVSIALMHMQSTPKKPSEINSTIAEGLEQIVMRAMQKDPAQRYQTAGEMIKDLEEFRKNPGIVFDYKYNSTDGTTKYFDRPIPAADQERRRRQQPQEDPDDDEDDDYDEDEEDTEVSKSSYFVVALTAIAAAVIIIAVVFITIVILKNFGGSTDTEEMVNLVGYDYQECKSTYAQYFDLVVDQEKYDSEIPQGCIISHTPKAGTPIIVGNTQVKAVVSKGPQMVIVPNVYSLEPNTATSMLKGAGLNVSIVMQNSDIDKNTVIETDPPRNAEAEIGSTVLMYVSLGPEIYDVVMPNVVGTKKAEAVATLEGMGFTVQLQAEDSAEEEDTVISQSIPALTEDGESNVVSPDQTVVLTYSSGKLPTAEVSITFAVPDNLKGKATFNAYVNGNIAGTISVDNIAYVSTISVPVEGTDTQKVVLEAADSKGDTNIIGEYTIDFTAQTVTELKFDKDLLRQMFGVPGETTTVTQPIGGGSFSDPYDPNLDGNGGYDDWWNSIINAY